MPRRTKAPSLTCPKCGRAIIVIRQGRRYRECDAESFTVITATGETATGYRRHACGPSPIFADAKVAKVRTRKTAPVEPGAANTGGAQ